MGEEKVIMDKIGLTNEFAKDRTIFMEGSFDEEKCQLLTKQLLYLYGQDKKSDIVLYIDSYGGDVCSFLQIYNLIESFKCNVHTIASGKAMSAGAYLLLSGTKGKRFAYKHSQIMLHELAYSERYNKLHEQKSRFEYAAKLMEVLYKITKSRTKIKNVEEYLKDDRFISSEEALSLGIIDEII
jgi:ATP-dependent Clp protease protease subunit